MIALLTLSLLLPVTASTPSPRPIDNPPIRVKISDAVYTRGDRARVRVTLAKDGYLVVLRMDTEGHVRVLYPVNPTDSGAVRGGRELEVRSRGDRDAFTVTDRDGSGVVLAARSDQPFQFDEFTQRGHWDYRAFDADTTGGDPEATLVDLIDRMSDGHFDYDVVTYTVGSQSSGRMYVGVYDPWYFGLYSPCFGGCFYGPRFGFRAGFGFGHFHSRGFRRH